MGRVIDRHTPELVIGFLLAALVGIGLLTGGDSEDEEPERSVETVVAEVPDVARRVEELRGLRFERRPEPRIVSADQARREGLADLDRRYPAAERAADEEVLKLLGLVDAGVDLRDVEASVFEGQVSGYYDTRKDTLALVRESAGLDPVTAEIVLAHELTHALEDDRLEIDEPSGEMADESLAYAALVEGTATRLMLDYTERHIGAGGALGAALSSLGSAVDAPELPDYVMASLEFPYVAGADFVERLRAAAGGDWKLADHALRHRPPVSTEQVLHPEKYLANERPRHPRPRVGPLLGAGWRRVNDGTFGEFETRRLLIASGASESDAAGAAAGWGGGRFELWRRGPIPDRSCPAPCGERDVLVIAWRWDTEKDAQEFAEALDSFAEEVDTRAAVRRRGAGVVLSLAPSEQLATRLKQRAAGLDDP